MIERVWSTPKAVFDKLNAEFRFQVDVCAEAENTKCKFFFDRSFSLSCSWKGTCWLNPPYGKEIHLWLAKAREAAYKGATVVALIPGRTNAPWWHEHVMKAEEIRFVRKKMSFHSPDGKRGVPGWGAVIAIFRPANGATWTPKCYSWDQPAHHREAVARERDDERPI